MTLKVELDGRRMTDRGQAHDYLAEMLRFPGYYGRNLDALYDLLSETKEPLEITLTHCSELKEQLGNYGQMLLTTLQEAENDFLMLTVNLVD